MILDFICIRCLQGQESEIKSRNIPSGVSSSRAFSSSRSSLSRSSLQLSSPVRSLSVHPPSPGRCLLCGDSNGYLVFTTDGEYIHKRCGLLLRGIVYHLQGSIFAKKSENDTEAYLRSFIQFVLPRTECLGLVESTRLRCHVCGKKAGFMVRCSVKGCGSVIIGTLNDL